MATVTEVTEVNGLVLPKHFRLNYTYVQEIYKDVSIDKRAIELLHTMESGQIDSEQLDLIGKEITRMAYCLSSLLG